MKFKKTKLLIIILLILAVTLCLTSCNKMELDESNEDIEIVSTNIKNVILVIGDGMGYKHIEAGELAYNTDFAFTNWKSVDSNTDSYNKTLKDVSKTTDSAAGATALATGNITINGYVGKDIDGNDLQTIMDIAIQKGKATGIVTTDKMYGATPSGFSAHSLSRDNTDEILNSQLESGVNLLMATSSDTCLNKREQIENSGYTMCTDFNNRNDLLQSNKAYCLFDLEGYGSSIKLKDASSFAMDYLSQDEDGYCLMIEMAHIDKRSHDNDFDEMVSYVNSLNDTVNMILEKIGDKGDTAVIVTADHETGDLKVSANSSTHVNKYTCIDGSEISYRFKSTSHTDTPVGCFIYGFDTDFSTFNVYKSSSEIKNTEIFAMMKNLIA